MLITAAFGPLMNLLLAVVFGLILRIILPRIMTPGYKRRWA